MKIIQIIEKGLTSIYVNKDFDSVEHMDLKTNNEEFESMLLKYKNKNNKNTVIGSLYRHPHNSFNVFFQYLEGCQGKLLKENKELYLLEILT